MIEYNVNMHDGNDWIGLVSFPHRNDDHTIDIGEAIRLAVHTACRNSCRVTVYSPTTGKRYWEWQKDHTETIVSEREATLLPLCKTVAEWQGTLEGCELAPLW
jgi:hypothetical protein